MTSPLGKIRPQLIQLFYSRSQIREDILCVTLEALCSSQSIAECSVLDAIRFINATLQDIGQKIEKRRDPQNGKDYFILISTKTDDIAKLSSYSTAETHFIIDLVPLFNDV